MNDPISSIPHNNVQEQWILQCGITSSVMTGSEQLSEVTESQMDQYKHKKSSQFIVIALLPKASQWGEGGYPDTNLSHSFCS
jgi:hypothetical protein